MNGLDEGHLEDLDAFLGIAPPELDQTQEVAPEQTMGQQVISSLSGLESAPMPRPQGFGQSFVAGLSRGLGSAGSRQAAQRAKLEAGIAEREKTRQAANLRATDAYRAERGAGRRGLVMAGLQEQATANREERAANRETTRDTRESQQATEVYARNQEAALAAEQRGNKEWTRRHNIESKDKATTATTKPPTAAQQQALAFYNRASDAVNTITAASEGGNSLENRIAQSGAYKQFGLRAPNVMQNPDQRAYNQAKKAFTIALLRKESGAAISASEYDSIDKAYFVQPGDDPNVIAQKQRARQVALDGLKLASAPQTSEMSGAASGAVPVNPASFWRP